MDIEYTSTAVPKTTFSELSPGDVFCYPGGRLNGTRDPRMKDDEGGYTNLADGYHVDPPTVDEDETVIRLSARLVIDGEALI